MQIDAGPIFFAYYAEQKSFRQAERHEEHFSFGVPSPLCTGRLQDRIPKKGSLWPSSRHMKERLRKLLDVPAYLVFPVSCGNCGQPAGPVFSGGFCRTCLSSLRPVCPPFCDICGLPLHLFSLNNQSSYVCGDCRKSPPLYQSLRSYGAYEGVLRSMIHRFKYEGMRPTGRIIGGFLSDHFSPLDFNESMDVIVPVPLHPRRLKERGFNQSTYLGRVLASAWGMKRAFKPVLKKVRDTDPQSGLDKIRRRRNVRQAFILRKKGPIQGKAVLLVDDVVTTGATLNECAGVLRADGARAVYALTAARTLRR